MGVHKLLAATDFSLCSDIATKHALNIARAKGATIVLTHVWDANARDSAEFAREGAVMLYESVLRDAREAARRQLTMRAEQLRARGVHVRDLLLEGHPDEELCRAARHEAADLVIVGTHGRRLVERVLLGSVTERVLRRCNTPVMVGRDTTRPEYRHVLVGLDFTPPSEHALFHAVELASPGTVIDIVHCLTHPPRDAAARAEVESDAARTAARVITAHASEGIDFRFQCLAGEPEHILLSLLDRGEHDLVCVGSHGRRGIAGVLLGSVAIATARHAHCSVLVCRAPKPM